MTVIVTLLITYVALALLITAGGRVTHAYLYTDVPAALIWRGPLAAALIWLAGLAGPAAFNAASGPAGLRWPISFNDIFLFNAVQEEVAFKEFIVRDGRETRYPRTGRGQYRDNEGRPVPLSAQTIIGVTEHGEEITLTVLKDQQGYIDRSMGTRYMDEQGRIMDEFGRLTSIRLSQFFLIVAGVVITWGVWFIALWLLIDLELGHALLASIPLFLIWIFIWNTILI